MKAIHAIYERGVFRPLEVVDLPEATEVVLEQRPVLPLMSPEGHTKVAAVLAERFDSGETDVAARHDEHGPGPSLLDLADHAEPMGRLTNAEIDQAIYGS